MEAVNSHTTQKNKMKTYICNSPSTLSAIL